MASHRDMDLEPGHESLSHSRRTTFRQCRRKFWLKYEQDINPKELSAPLRMGGIYADALEKADPEIVTVKYNDLIADAIHAGQSYTADRYLDELAVVHPMVVTYIEHVMLKDVTREVEFTGITSNGFQDNGRLDGLDLAMEAKEPGMWLPSAALIVENKLKGRWERAMEADVKLSEDQLTSYFFNIQRIHELEAGQIKARYEVAKKPQLRKRQGDTDQVFRARVTADILSRPEHYHVVINDIERTQEQLDEFAILFNRMTEDLVDERFKESNEHPGAWPKNPSACSDFGGCEYARICWARNGDEVAQVIATDFITNRKENTNG